jgi:hypothetical protein
VEQREVQEVLLLAVSVPPSSPEATEEAQGVVRLEVVEVEVRLQVHLVLEATEAMDREHLQEQADQAQVLTLVVVVWEATQLQTA